jgi:hypothetical protein
MKEKFALAMLLLGLAIFSTAHASVEEDLAAIEQKLSGSAGTSMPTGVVEQPTATVISPAYPPEPGYYNIDITDVRYDGSRLSVTVVNTGSFVLHNVRINVLAQSYACPEDYAKPCLAYEPQFPHVATISELYSGQQVTISVWYDKPLTEVQVGSSEGVTDVWHLNGNGHDNDLNRRVDRLEQRVGNIEGLIWDLISLVKRVLGMEEPVVRAQTEPAIGIAEP